MLWSLGSRSAVLVSGGLSNFKTSPEVDLFNFAPHVHTPTLMLNGRYDFAIPSATSQQPLFRLLGTPEQDKRHVQFDAGHIPPLEDVMREVLNWLDRYVGPVATDR